MSDLEGWLIVLGLIGAYAAAVAVLYRAGRIGPDRSLSLFYVALMLKTRRGQAFLDRVGRFRRFWSVVGDVGIALASIAMVTIVALLALEAILITRVPASEAPSPQTALGIPGINPIIPVGYGLIALVVGVVLHELFHGVIARSQRIGVKSIGILWLVIPIGAFVEQDDEGMQKAPRRARDRVVAAGVLANFALATVFFLGSSALVQSSVAPNADGVGVAQVLGGYAAQNASIHPGDILVTVNGSATPNNTALFDALQRTHPGQSVPIVYYSADAGTMQSTTASMSSLAAFTGNRSDAGRGFLGVVVTPFPPREVQGIIATPWATPAGPLAGFAAWVALPIWGLEPVAGTTAGFFHAVGPLAGLGLPNLWIAVNLLYWLAWMNLLLGLSNALPIYPFDGGLLFRDFMGSIVDRIKRGWDVARREQAAFRASAVATLLVFLLIAWLFIGPRF